MQIIKSEWRLLFLGAIFSTRFVRDSNELCRKSKVVEIYK